MFLQKKVAPIDLLAARDHLFWDQRSNPPALDSLRLTYRIMDIGTWQMIEHLERYFSKEHLVDALKKAPFGALSKRSWNFWCLRLGVNLQYPDRFSH